MHDDNIYEFFDLIEKELHRANSTFPSFHSPHEGYAVIKEELDELWDEIKSIKIGKSDAMKEEIIQVGAMALKFFLDICKK